MNNELTHLTPREVADMCFLSEQIVRLYCRKGVFPGAYLVRGTRWVIPEEDATDLLEGRLSVKGVFAKGGD